MDKVLSNIITNSPYTVSNLINNKSVRTVFVYELINRTMFSLLAYCIKEV